METLDTRMVVHIYNPSHDEALAMNREQYCPSSAARRTAAAFWDVARHWAAPGDYILRLPDDGSLRGAAFYSVASLLSAPLPSRVPSAPFTRDSLSVPTLPSAPLPISSVTFDWSKVTIIDPWGWDRHIVGVLRRLGAPDRLVPTEAQLDRIRELSSRHTAVRVLELLNRQPSAEVNDAAPVFTSRWCTNEDEVNAAIRDFGGLAMLKQPWSCSGRGVWRSDMGSSEQRIRKTLREQNAVEVEPLYVRTADFAMEFYADADGSVRYEGLSLFETHDGGGYAGNVIAPQSELRCRLEALAPPSLLDAEGRLPLDELAARLCSVLSEVLSPLPSHLFPPPSSLLPYEGPLGVDMMLTPEGIHPCIEVNLRNTMGRVAIFQARAK